MALRPGAALADLSPTQLDLEAWLAAPPRQLSLEALPTAWRHVVIRVVCPRPPELDARMALLNKVRGALGNALLDGASPAARARLPCPWHPPCALDLLFRQRPLPGVISGAPPPYSLAADIVGRGLHIAVTLFGIAAETCAAEVADGLVRGLRNGIALDVRRNVPLEVTHRVIERREKIDRRRPSAERLVLRFLTPVGPRPEGHQVGSAPAILRGTFNRVAGLARWLGICVIENHRWLDERLRAVHLEERLFNAPPARYRHSISSPESGYLIPALTGSLAVTGDWRELWPLLVLGETAHAGGRATQGYGRYRLETA